MSNSPTREELIALCERAIVPESEWHDRDSCGAHGQVGEAWAYLKAGCGYSFMDDMCTERTHWVAIRMKGFGYFDHEAGLDENLFYIPTDKRLNESDGDWY